MVKSRQTKTNQEGSKMEVDDKKDVNLANLVTKRKAGEETPERTMKKKKGATIYTAQQAVQLMNEKFGPSEFTYTLISPAPPTGVGYVATAIVQEVSFEGTGASKVNARRDLAKKALFQLLNIMLPEEPPLAQQTGTVDVMGQSTFPGIQGFNPYPSYVAFSDPAGQQGAAPMPINMAVVNPGKRNAFNQEKARTQPVLTMKELFPELQLDWDDENGRGDRQFKVEAIVEGRRFYGEGRSKKAAQLNLAKTILMCMYNIHEFPEADAKEPKEKSSNQKFPVTQLKELVGDDEIKFEVVEELDDGQEKTFHATVVVRGVAYEAIGSKSQVAKMKAAKKALNVLRPKKEGSLVNKHGVDVSKHPIMAFKEHYPTVEFTETEVKTQEGGMENSIQAVIGGKAFCITEKTKKKAKLRLVLQVFKEMKKTSVSEWTAEGVKDAFLVK